MVLCMYYWSIGAPILLGDGVLDEGPISEEEKKFYEKGEK